MTDVQEDKEAIRELIARYCFHFDNGEFEAWLDLFTDDGVFDLGARGCFAGRAALRKFLTNIPLTDGQPLMRHFVTNVIIKVHGDGARADSYVLVVRGGDSVGISVAGRYEDRFVKVGGAWRFRERRVHFDLMAPMSA
jgi:ketosteroid isomerase-like protein